MLKQRIEYLDTLKGILIWLVIIGHAGIRTVTYTIYIFHMPMFFLLSGYFMSQTSSFQVYVGRKIKQLIRPYIFSGVIILVVSLCIDFINGNYHLILDHIVKKIESIIYCSGTVNSLTLFPVESIGATWFLPALCIALIGVKFISEKKSNLIWVITLLIATFSWVSAKYIWLPFSFQSAGVAMIYVSTGYFAKRYFLLEKKPNTIIALLGICILIVFMIFDIYINAAKNYYPLFLISIGGSILISYSLTSILFYMDRYLGVVKLYFMHCGKNTLVILCLHNIEMMFIPWNHLVACGEKFGINIYVLYFLILVAKAFIWEIGIFLVNKLGFLKKIYSIS